MLAVLHETSRWCCLTNNSCCGLRQTQNERQQERLKRHFRFPSRWIKNANTQKPIPTPQSWTSVSGRPGGVLHAPIFASLSGAHTLCVHPDVHALYETVWGFLDTIPDIKPIKVRLSPPASSSDYLTAGSGLQWLIPRQSLRLVQHTEKECIQRPDDENKNTCWGSRPKRKRHVLPRPSDVGYNSADFTCQGSYFKIKCDFLSKSTKHSSIGSETSSHFRARTASSIQPQARRAVALTRQTKPKMRSGLPAFPAPAGGSQPSKVCLIWGNKPVSHPVGRNDNRRPLKPSTAETMMWMSGPHDPSESFGLFTICVSHWRLRHMYMKGIPRWLDDDWNSLSLLLRRVCFYVFQISYWRCFRRIWRTCQVWRSYAGNLKLRGSVLLLTNYQKSLLIEAFSPTSPHFVPFLVLSGWNYLPHYLKLPVILLITVISGCGRHVFWQAWVTLAPIMWDVTEVKTVHFPSKSEEVLICWVKALLEGRGQSVIGPLQEYEIATTMMLIHTLSDTSRLNTLSIFLVALGETVRTKLRSISRIWMIIAQLCPFPVVIQPF